MYAIQESEWGQVVVHTWGNLTPHLWEDFRLALMEAETEQEVQGVLLKYSKAINEVITEQTVQGVKIVQSPIIMQTRTEMITSIVVSERDYKTDMLKYLPLYERKSLIFNEVIDAYDREFRNVEQRLEITKRNIFLDTAIESLPIFERDLGIKTMNTLRYDQRREQISSRYIASFDQTTEDTIKSVAKAYSNGDVEVNASIVDGVFEIKFVGAKGIPDNIEGLQKAIDIIAPAHLEFRYLYTFNPWEFLSKKTWGEIQTKTWNDLRIWNEVI